MTMAQIRVIAVATVVAITTIFCGSAVYAVESVILQTPPSMKESSEEVDFVCNIEAGVTKAQWGQSYRISYMVSAGTGKFWLNTSQFPDESVEITTGSGVDDLQFPDESAADAAVRKDGVVHSIVYGANASTAKECGQVVVKPSGKPQQVVARSTDVPKEARYTAFARQSGDPNRAIPAHIGGSKAAIARSIRECGSNNVFYDGACDALVEALRDREGLPITDRESLAAYIESDQVWTEPCTPEMLKSGHMYRYDREEKRADANLVRTRCYEKEFTLVHNSEFYGKEHKFLLSGCLNASHYFGKPIPLVVIDVPVKEDVIPLGDPKWIECDCNS